MGLFSRASKPVNVPSSPLRVQSLHSPFDAKLQLITGKGGVGRTTVAISLASAYAARGEETLVLEVRDAESELNEDAEGEARTDSMLGRALYQSGVKTSFARSSKSEVINIGAKPIQLSKYLWAAQLVAPVGHAAFLRSMIPSDRLVKAALDSAALSKFLRSAPSMHELGLFYHLKLLADEDRFKHIVVDLPATGHALALAQLPERISKIIKRGQIVDGLRAGVKHIADPQHSSLWVVTLPELLPLTEASEVSEALKDDGFVTAGVICNRSTNLDLTEDDHQMLDQMRQGDREGEGRVTWLVGLLQNSSLNTAERGLLKKFSCRLMLPELIDQNDRTEYIKERWLSEMETER